MRMLEFGFMQRALIACTVVCGVAPLAGAFVVQRRQSLVGDGLGHVAFAGVGLAFLLGVSPMAGALVLTVLAAVMLVRLQRGGLAGDLSLALIFYGGIALGFLFAQRSGAGLNTLLGFLFGSPLSLAWSTVAAIVALSLTTAAIMLVLYRPLVALAFDEQAARVSGVPTDRLVLALTVVVGVIVVGGMNAIGLLLIAAMMVVPVAAASQVAHSYRGTMATAAGIGVGSALVGLTVAFYADYTPGASIVLTAIASYALAVVVRGLRGRSLPRLAKAGYDGRAHKETG
ncbi:MAG: metal ABC transporter permease [Egibacteraceae bacterium]